MGFFENKIVQIVIAILITFGAVWILGYGSQNNMYPWYDGVKKPSWNPPSWVFGPVWAFLYLAMAYASFRVYDAGDGFSGAARFPLIVYIVHLIINGTWSQVFFNLHMIGAATIHIIVLLIAAVFNGILFYRVDQIAGILFAPYLAWLSFATVLSVTIWRLNS